MKRDTINCILLALLVVGMCEYSKWRERNVGVPAAPSVSGSQSLPTVGDFRLPPNAAPSQPTTSEQ